MKEVFFSINYSVLGVTRLKKFSDSFEWNRIKKEMIIKLLMKGEYIFFSHSSALIAVFGAKN